MAQITNTEAAVVIVDEILDAEVLKARYESAVIMPNVLNKSELVKEKGNVITIPIRPKFAAGTVGADGSFTPLVGTYTSIQITVNTWAIVPLEVKDDTEQFANVNLKKDLATDFGSALAVKYDQDLAALDTSVTTNVIGTADNPVTFDDTVALAAFLKLRKLNVPKKDLFFVLNPDAFYAGLLLKDRFTDADKTGLAKSTVLTGDIGHPIFGAPGYESNLLSVRGSSNAAFLMHKEAMAIGMSYNNKVEEARRTPNAILSTLHILTGLYGVKIGRENHACKIHIKLS